MANRRLFVAYYRRAAPGANWIQYRIQIGADSDAWFDDGRLVSFDLIGKLRGWVSGRHFSRRNDRPTLRLYCADNDLGWCVARLLT